MGLGPEKLALGDPGCEGAASVITDGIVLAGTWGVNQRARDAARRGVGERWLPAAGA